MPSSDDGSHGRSRSSSPVGRKPRRRSNSGDSTMFPASAESKGERSTLARTSDCVLGWLLNRLARAAILMYGLFCFCIFAARGLIEGCILNTPGNQFWAELVSERSRLWDLSRPPSHGLKHAFYSFINGSKFHYLTNNLKFSREDADTVRAKIEKRPNLIIFIHGWPDSCMLWQDVISRLRLPLKEDTTLVAVDLPGFGGSDGIAQYSAGAVINALFEFILAMRVLYLGEGTGNRLTDNGAGDGVKTALERGKVLIVAHDWGAICGFQLAARAPQLADRFILCNSILPHLVCENIGERGSTAFKIFSEWKRNCSGKPFPTKAIGPLMPVIRQLWLSAYIFIFNLPVWLANASMTRCNLWAMRFISSMAVGYGMITHTPKVVSHMASFLGPNILTCDTKTPDGEAYGDSVHLRAREELSTQSLRYYREGLGTHLWRRGAHHALALHGLDLYNHNSRGKKLIGALEMWPPGRLNAPATIIWGARDPALDARLALEGMDEYLTRESQVIRLPKVGHWVPLEGKGPAVIAAVIEWAMDHGNTDALEAMVCDASEDAKLTVKT